MTATCRDILEAIGDARVAREFRVTLKSTNRYANTNQFPASWFFVMRVLAAEVGIECPPDLFSFKTSELIDFDTSKDAAGLCCKQEDAA